MKLTTRKITVAALFMALAIILSSSIFSIEVPGGHLYFNDIVIVLASLILDPVSAFAVGGIGAFLGDLIFYPTPMFVSLVTHGLQAVAISVIAHKTFKKKPVLAAILAVTVGALINVVGYTLGRAFLYATPATAMTKLPFQILQAAFGAILGPILYFKTGIRKLAEKVLNEDEKVIRKQREVTEK